MREIEFVKDKKYIDDNHLLIHWDDQDIDYYKTLKPFSSINEKYVILVEESYFSPKDGFNLIIRIRCAYFFNKKLACSPIILLSEPNINDAIRIDTKYSILLTENCFFIDEWDEKKHRQLFHDELKIILMKLPIRVLQDSHDLANEWGAQRLIYGLELLSSSEEDVDYIAPERYKKEYYWYLLSNNSLNPIAIDDDITALKKKFKELSNFTYDNLKKVNILVVDDKLSLGWHEALEKLFSLLLISYEVKYLEPKSMNDIIESELFKNDFDLVLCDLRLFNSDIASGTILDELHIKDISGSKLIQKLKYSNPPVKIIAFTASNKAWTLQYLKEKEGIIDGYWIKENPQRGISDIYTLRNVISLASEIKKLLEKKERTEFLWQLIMEVHLLIDSELYVDSFLVSSKRKTSIKKLLNNILELLKKAYGILDHGATKFRAKVLSYDKYEMAFLHIWGCLNFIIDLRIEKLEKYYLNREDKYYNIRYLKSNVLYAKYYSKSHYLVFNNGWPRFQTKNKDDQKYFNPSTEDSIYVKKIVQMDESNCQKRKEKLNLFENCRILRNHLTITHGSLVKKLKPTLNDLVVIVKIVHDLLLIEDFHNIAEN